MTLGARAKRAGYSGQRKTPMKRAFDRELPPLELLVFVVGAASLGAEIAGARLMSPFFGASTIVWANVIGVVLVSLAVGYWFGGRFADRHPHRRGLCTLALVAGLAVGLIPFAADPFLDISVEALDEVQAGAFLGSLFAVTILVAPPVMLLAAVSPYAIRLMVGRIEEAGAVAGRIYAISTVGSLAGVWLSALLLIPAIGTRRTFIAFGLACALVAVVGIPRRRAVLVPAVLVVLLALPVGTIKASKTSSGKKVLDETETTYQYARVVEESDGDRKLELNEGQAVHSMYRPGSYLTDDVWDEYLVLPFAVLQRPPERIAILGNAAGTTARAYGHYFPETAVDGVEIDAELTDIGRRWFDMRNPRLDVFHEDARPFLRRIDRRYDVIMVDAYRQPYIPFYLTTREFFELARDRLEPGGVVVVNAGHPEGQDDLEKVLGATLAEVFPTVVRDPSQDTNTLLLGSMAPASAAGLERALRDEPPELQRLGRATAARIGPRLEGGSVYTDDKAPVEWLIDRSIVDYAASGD
jgi:predicted membrane-bound spermidine synthase